MADDICYEIEVRKNGSWVRFGVASTPQQAEQEARAALEERKYLEGYKIVCERRDGRTGKINKVAFAPVLRVNLHDAADENWQQHVHGKPSDAAASKKKSTRRVSTWLIPVVFLIAIMWGAFFLLDFLRAQIFTK